MESKIEISNYPLVSDRYKAAFIDGIVMIGCWFLFSMIFSAFDHVSESIKIGAYIFSVFLYEPLFVSLFGGSIGHLSGNMHVVRESDHSRKINIFAALVRFAVKLLLGIISLFSISKENKGRAIHDKAVRSIVLFKDQENKTTLL
ncbi:RDD family protein [Bacteroidia bacterium]|nr:RDD family protein [Bacteroidia bacterium]MDB4107401.1 RDD family protein [Bacteroidia bacterium]MDB9883189.1 RDD family protein [Bacteroidia bacterium]